MPAQRILLPTGTGASPRTSTRTRGTSLHLLLVPHQHAGDLLELAMRCGSDFWVALAAAADKHTGCGHYGLGVRNGDCRFTGATIAHVHAHVLVGVHRTQDAPPVRMRFSSRPGIHPYQADSRGPQHCSPSRTEYCPAK